MKSLFRNIVSLGPPWLEDWLKQSWQRRHIRRFMKAQGIPAVTAAWVKHHGLRVLSGPFTGMNFLNESAGSMLVPKLLGSYEAELHPILAELLQNSSNISKIIDVGCAEGYYAVGFACRLPGVMVHAYDTDRRARQLCHEMAKLNDVSARIEIHGRCDAGILNELGLNGALVVCDCEGFEYQLLNPQMIPSLRHAQILVELHGTKAETEGLVERFRVTHQLKTIAVSKRTPDGFPDLAFLAERAQNLAICEFRNPDQQWAYLEPRGLTKAD